MTSGSCSGIEPVYPRGMAAETGNSCTVIDEGVRRMKYTPHTLIFQALMKIVSHLDLPVIADMETMFQLAVTDLGPLWNSTEMSAHCECLDILTRICPGAHYFFFVASAFRPVWPGRCDLSFICIPQSTRALDQGGVEPRQAVSPKALRPWTIPLRYSVGYVLVRTTLE